MSAVLEASPIATSLPPEAETKVTLGRVLKSEWIKFRSLRSTYWTLAAGIVLTVGFGALLCWAMLDHFSQLHADERASFNPTDHSLRGYYLAQMAIGVLGVLMFTGEYSTGMIRATVSAVPKRLPVLWAKAIVFGVATWVVGTLSALAAFFIGQAIFSSKHIGASFSDPGVPRAVFGLGLYLTAIGLIAVGLGALLRNTAAGISSLFGMLLVLPLLVEALPSSWQSNISPYLPGAAGGALFTLHGDPGALSPWVGFGVLCIYVVAALAGGAAVLRRKDA